MISKSKTQEALSFRLLKCYYSTVLPLDELLLAYNVPLRDLIQPNDHVNYVKLCTGTLVANYSSSSLSELALLSEENASMKEVLPAIHCKLPSRPVMNSHR